MGYSNTGILGYSNTRIVGDRDTVIQEYWDKKDTWIQKDIWYTRIQGTRDTGIQGHNTLRILGYT